MSDPNDRVRDALRSLDGTLDDVRREQSWRAIDRALDAKTPAPARPRTWRLPVFALVVARNGPKLKASVDDPNAPRPRGTMWSGGRKKFEFNSWTMGRFARTLESDVDRPVIDMTGLEGAYDIRLEFAETRSGFGPPDLGPPDPNAPELFTALTEHLGLRLESRWGPVDVLIVDSALRQPTEN